MYGEEALYQDALNILLPDAYDNAVEETGIFPVTQPKIDIESIEKGKPWVIKAEVIVKPEVKLGVIQRVNGLVKARIVQYLNKMLKIVY